MLVFRQLKCIKVGVTGFEPATTRPPDVEGDKWAEDLLKGLKK